MKKFVLVLFAIVSTQISFAQCTPDGSIITPGVIMSASTLDCIDRGVYYSDTIQFRNFDSLYLNNTWLRLEHLKIDSVNNLPCGINWDLSNSNNIYDNSEYGCILVSGTTNDSIGQYKLEIWASVDLGGGFFGPISASDFDLLTFYVRVKPPVGVCPPIDTLAFNHTSDCGVHFGLPVDIESSEGDTICNDIFTVLTVDAPLGSGHYSYMWSPNTNLSCDDCPSPEYYPVGGSLVNTYAVTVTDSVSGLSSSDTITLYTEICEGIEEYSYSRLNIYPNPGEGTFFIQTGSSSSNTFDLSIKNIQGQEVIAKNYVNEGSRLELDMGDMPAGIYFVYVTDGSVHYMNKIVKK